MEDVLPLELWGMVLGLVPTRELYPSCFVVSKRLLRALLEFDSEWQSRCERDLGIVQTLDDDKAAWLRTYKETCRVFWQVYEPIRSADLPSYRMCINAYAHKIGAPGKTIAFGKQQQSEQDELFPCIVDRGYAQHLMPDGFFAIRSRGSLKEGKHCIDFVMRDMRSSYDSLSCVGLVDQRFDVRGMCFTSPIALTYTLWHDIRFYNAAGTSEVWKASLLTHPPLRDTKHLVTGEHVGLLIDFETHNIHWFRNNKYLMTMAIQKESEELWPSVTLGSMKDAIEVMARPHNTYAPPADKKDWIQLTPYPMLCYELIKFEM